MTHNGAPLLRRAPLQPGDLLGLGQHFLLLYKDPRLGDARPAWLPRGAPSPGVAGALGCPGCGRSPHERHEAVRAVLESAEAELRYRAQDEEALLREVVGMEGGAEVGLSPAFLLGLCLQHAAKAMPPPHLPELLNRVAVLVKERVWVWGGRWGDGDGVKGSMGWGWGEKEGGWGGVGMGWGGVG